MGGKEKERVKQADNERHRFSGNDALVRPTLTAVAPGQESESGAKGQRLTKD